MIQHHGTESLLTNYRPHPEYPRLITRDQHRLDTLRVYDKSFFTDIFLIKVDLITGLNEV